MRRTQNGYIGDCLYSRFALLAPADGLEGFDQAGLFAAAAMDDDVAGVARAQDVLAEETLGLGDRAFANRGAVAQLTCG